MKQYKDFFIKEISNCKLIKAEVKKDNQSSNNFFIPLFGDLIIPLFELFYIFLSFIENYKLFLFIG